MGTLETIGRDSTSHTSETISLNLAYRAPYDWERILSFLKLRAIPGVESISNDTYHRTARIPTDSGDILGWLSVRNLSEKQALEIQASNSLLPAIPQVIERVQHLFDTECNPEAVAAGLRAFDRDCPGKLTPGTRLPGCFDPYEMIVRAILGQQISVKGASTLAGRVAAIAGTPIEANVEGLTHVFPSPAQIAALPNPHETLGSLGIIGRRVNTIIAIAEKLNSGELSLEYGTEPASAIASLEALPGIGPWTAQYLAMRIIGYADAFPSTDLGVKKALAPRQGKEIASAAEAWRPWRAYATISLWCSH